MAKVDRFTQRAQRVLNCARQETEASGEQTIRTDHLLLGLLLIEGSTAYQVLKNLNISVDQVRATQKKLKEEEPTLYKMLDTVSPVDGLSKELQSVLQRAIEDAKASGQIYIGTEHIILGLTEVSRCSATMILEMSGVDQNRLRTEIFNVMSEGITPPNPEKLDNEQPVEPPQRKAPQQTVKRTLPQKGVKEKNGSPLIDQLATDLTSKAAAGKLDPVIGRKTEIDRVIQILARRTKNNPALIGEPGVGKTAIVEGLAQAITEGNVPAQLLNKRVLQLDVGSLVAGTMYRGQFEDRMKRVIEELKETKAILFIDEIHMLVGAGSSGSAVDAANILKPALSRGELQVIGATTLEEYRKNIEKDAALERRFQPIVVNEPTPEETVEILKGIRDKYENHHHLTISDEALETAVRLSVRYVSERFLPDKAIDLIDEASSRVRMYKSETAAASNVLMEKLRAIRKEIASADDKGDKDAVDTLRVREDEIENQIETVNKNWDKATSPVVNGEDIAEVVSMWTGVPTMQMAKEESEKLLKMEETLQKQIIGQNEAIKAISHALRRSRSGLKDPRRPIGSFLFLGPTGVGKTELTKALAKFLFGSEDALIQLDMSEFMERHTASRLTGAPPGYVGYDDAGQLTEAIRRRPYSIVVFDEIDKANQEVHNILLQIMEEGHLSDSRGKKVDFRNTIIVMTSNIGADVIRKQSGFGFALNSDDAQGEKENYEDMRRKLMEQLKKAFRPEFLNRLDNIVVFRMLNLEDMQQITELELQKVADRLSDKEIQITATETALEKITRDGFDPEMGARPLRRVIQQCVEDPLSDELLSHQFESGDTVIIGTDSENEIVLSKKVPQIAPQKDEDKLALPSG